jgi:hypothetical protein
MLPRSAGFSRAATVAGAAPCVPSAAGPNLAFRRNGPVSASGLPCRNVDARCGKAWTWLRHQPTEGRLWCREIGHRSSHSVPSRNESVFTKFIERRSPADAEAPCRKGDRPCARRDRRRRINPRTRNRVHHEAAAACPASNHEPGIPKGVMKSAVEGCHPGCRSVGPGSFQGG